MAAWVLGTAANQDGRSSSLTAPNGPAQQAAIKAALRTAGCAASSLCGLQMHGTGTALGDPVEVGAAHPLVASATNGKTVVFAAAKSNAGHTEAAAGAVGMLHGAFSLSQRTHSLLTHLRQLSMHVGHVLGSTRSNATVSPAGGGVMLPRLQRTSSRAASSSVLLACMHA